MINYKDLQEKGICWTGYKRKKGTKPYEEGSCVKEDKDAGGHGSEKHHAMVFGRMNPPTAGHEQVVNKMHEVAKKNNATHGLVLSGSHDTTDKEKKAGKNPLSPEQKVAHAKNAFSGTNITAAKRGETILHHAAAAHASGTEHLHVIAGSDRHKDLHDLLHKYNGQKAAHGHYNFKSITLHSSGERDPDSEGTSGISGSKMRQHAASGNKEGFHSGAPSKMKPEHKDAMYNDLRKSQGLKENIEEELRADMGAAAWVKDFISSTHPRFNNKSKEERRKMAIGAFMAAKSKGVKEAIDKEHPITKEYNALKKHDIKTLRGMIGGQHKIVDTSEYKTKDHAISAYLRTKHGDKKVATAFGLNESEEHIVHVNDGSKYGEQPHDKDAEHVMAGVKKHNGEFDGHSDKGAFFKFKSHTDAKNFKRHVDSCPHKTCDADLHESALNPADVHGDYKAKSKALQDIQLDAHTHKDSELSKELIKRKADLEKEYEPHRVTESRGHKIVKSFLQKRGAWDTPTTCSKCNKSPCGCEPKTKIKEGTLQGNIGGGDAMNTTTSAPSASTVKDTTMGKKIKGFKFFNGENDRQMNMNQPVKEEKKDDVPFDGPYTSSFKKPHNPNRTGMDAARSLAQRAMDQLSKKKPVKEQFETEFTVLEEAAKAIDSGEYDYEGQMARTQLQTTLRNCQDLIGMIEDDENMPEWVQSKITLAQDYITTVRDYLQSKEELGEETLDERNKANALMRKTMDASRGARFKVQNNLTGDAVRDWDGKHKTPQAQNKAIGRALRNEATTGNPGFGYHGQHKTEHDADAAYKTIHAHVKSLTDADDKTVKHYLDSAHGRHLVGHENDHEHIKKDFKKFSKYYKPEMHEATAQKGVNVDKVNHAGDTPHEEKWEPAPKTVSKLKKVKEENMKSYKEFLQSLDEKLIGKQHKIDKNKNNKVDAEDFELLRKEEADHLLEYESDESGVYRHTKKATYGTSYNPKAGHEETPDDEKAEKMAAGRKTGQRTGSYKPRQTMSKLKQAGSTYK